MDARWTLVSISIATAATIAACGGAVRSDPAQGREDANVAGTAPKTPRPGGVTGSGRAGSSSTISTGGVGGIDVSISGCGAFTGGAGGEASAGATDPGGCTRNTDCESFGDCRTLQELGAECDYDGYTHYATRCGGTYVEFAGGVTESTWLFDADGKPIGGSYEDEGSCREWGETCGPAGPTKPLCGEGGEGGRGGQGGGGAGGAAAAGGSD